MAALRLPSIRRRLAWSLLGISLVSGVLVSGLVGAVVGSEIDELMDLELRSAAEIILQLQDGSAGRGWPAYAGYQQTLVWQRVDAGSGELLDRSHNAPVAALTRLLSPASGVSEDGRWRFMTLAIDTRPAQILVVAQSRHERDQTQRDAVLVTLSGALLMGGMAALLVYWRLRRELMPLDELSRAVQHYDPLLPRTLPALAVREELAPIEQAIHQLGRRLGQRILSERAFAAHAAHALRTPVAGIEAQLAIAMREAPEALRHRLGRAREATQRLNRVMQALLAMHRSGQGPRRQQTDLAELLSQLPSVGLQLEIRGVHAVSIDPDLLVAVLINLLDNASRHRARRVVIALERQAGINQLRLQDDGEGCAPDRLEHLRQALQRQDYAPDSVLKGLGLVLADLVMRSHGGAVLLPSVERGFCIELNWPEQG